MESTGEQVISEVYSQFQQLIVYSHLGLSFKWVCWHVYFWFQSVLMFHVILTFPFLFGRDLCFKNLCFVWFLNLCIIYFWDVSYAVKIIILLDTWYINIFSLRVMFFVLLILSFEMFKNFQLWLVPNIFIFSHLN